MASNDFDVVIDTTGGEGSISGSRGSAAASSTSLNMTEKMQPRDQKDLVATEVVTPDKNVDKQSKSAGVLIPPDGGWGWLVAAGCFLNTMLILSIVPSFGILFSGFLLDQGASSTTTAWIFNAQMCVWHLIGPMVGPLTQEFGWRCVAHVGVILTAGSIILSAFAPSAEFLFFSLSLFSGIGGGLVCFICFLILPTYFDRRRGTASTFLVSGICMGQIFGPPLVRYLRANFGFKGSCLIYGAIILNGCVGVSLFHPLEWHAKKAPKDEVVALTKGQPESSDDVEGKACETPEDWSNRVAVAKAGRLRSHLSGTESMRSSVSSIFVSTIAVPVPQQSQSSLDQVKTSNRFCETTIRLLKNTFMNLKTFTSMRVLIINIGIALVFIGFSNFIMMVPFVMRENGSSLQESAWCISAMGICNFVVRLIVSPLSDWPKFNLRVCYMFGYTTVVVSIFVFPLVSGMTSVVVMGALGCGIGANITLNHLLMIHYLGIHNLPAVFGASGLSLAAAFVTIGPIVGVVRDTVSSYTASIWTVAGMQVVGLVLWFFMPAAVAYDTKHNIFQ